MGKVGCHLRLIHVEFGRHRFHLPRLFLEAGLVHRQLLRDLRSGLLQNNRKYYDDRRCEMQRQSALRVAATL